MTNNTEENKPDFFRRKNEFIVARIKEMCDSQLASTNFKSKEEFLRWAQDTAVIVWIILSHDALKFLKNTNEFFNLVNTCAEHGWQLLNKDLNKLSIETITPLAKKKLVEWEEQFNKQEGQTNITE